MNRWNKSYFNVITQFKNCFSGVHLLSFLKNLDSLIPRFKLPEANLS